MEALSEKADKLIQRFSFGSGLTGFIPLPLVDVMSLISVQRLMLYRLSKLYGVPFKKNLGKAWVSTLVTGVSSSAVSPVIGYTLLKIIPGIGTLAGGASMATYSGASTYAVGKVFQKHFENGGTLDSFDPESAKGSYQKAFKKGEELALKKRK